MIRCLLVVSLVAVTGCQTFVGIDDVSGHLPYVDGEYLIGIKRVRADNTTMDNIRLRGNAVLNADTRSLTLSLRQLSATNGSVVAENEIAGLVFPDDASTVEFDLSVALQDAALTTPATGADASVGARMRLRLEGDYAVCAVPVTGALPTIGSILVTTATVTPLEAKFSYTCDELQQ
jgi:hypothetical protein